MSIDVRGGAGHGRVPVPVSAWALHYYGNFASERPGEGSGVPGLSDVGGVL